MEAKGEEERERGREKQRDGARERDREQRGTDHMCLQKVNPGKEKNSRRRKRAEGRAREGERKSWEKREGERVDCKTCKP